MLTWQLDPSSISTIRLITSIMINWQNNTISHISTADNLIDDRSWDNWMKFVKYSRIRTRHPNIAKETIAAHGTLHHCKLTLATDACALPVRDPDSWKQYCIYDHNFAVSHAKRVLGCEIIIEHKKEFFDFTTQDQFDETCVKKSRTDD